MKIFENKDKNGRRTSSCSYCRKQGHTKRDCPHPTEDWAYLSQYKIPIHETKIAISHWFKSPKYWGEWYNKCRSAVAYQQLREQNSITRRTRSAPACGFCRDYGHNRRNCSKMVAFIKCCKKANVNYRKAVHEVVVKELGLDIGAAIEVSENRGYGSNGYITTHIGLISHINWDQINVMTAYNGGWNENETYGQDFIINVLIDGTESQISFGEFHKNDKLELIKQRGGRWNGYKLTKIIGKSEVPLPDDWVTSYNDAWEYLVKKRTLEKLKEDEVYKHIIEWAKKDI